ncbi:hypothetical protein QYE76_010121 [Lolium multiflorum]|uniref:Reverse transcriptase Ty1/copia-type domain-containing protein n=1 Tax=Lolium multiflorum TaxID=4521 RepID=A0AAD8X4C2_LOLMU|nr:hypothetical protein QYE76_010121 [Lolium multiflorum]
MSMMGELKFFLGFQVRQLAKGTFISQEKYVKDMLKKFNMTNASPMKTPMPVKGQLGSCDGEKDVDIKMFRENLISKSGDTSECRNYHLNLMCYCRPDNIRAIDGYDLIYYELRRFVLGRMTPNYAHLGDASHSDEMFQNFDLSMYAHGGLPPRPARAPADADDDDEEDEGDEDDDDEDDDDE